MGGNGLAALVESLWRHRVMLLNPRYGKVGMLAFPYFFFLEVFGPIIEGLGYLTFLLAVVLGRASMPYVLAFLAVAFAFGIALSFQGHGCGTGMTGSESGSITSFDDRRDAVS